MGKYRAEIKMNLDIEYDATDDNDADKIWDEIENGGLFVGMSSGYKLAFYEVTKLDINDIS